MKDMQVKICLAVQVTSHHNYEEMLDVTIGNKDCNNDKRLNECTAVDKQALVSLVTCSGISSTGMHRKQANISHHHGIISQSQGLKSSRTSGHSPDPTLTTRKSNYEVNNCRNYEDLHCSRKAVKKARMQS